VLKLNETRQLLVCADERCCVIVIKENTEALLGPSKENGVELRGTSKYRHQNTGPI
jgi:hypothetical protein